MLSEKQAAMRASAAWLIGELGNKDLALSELLNIIKNDPVEIVKSNVTKARKKINAAYLNGEKTTDEALIECAKTLLSEQKSKSGSTPTLRLESLLIKATGITSRKAPTLLYRLGILTEAGLFANESGPESEFILIPDPDALDLFLYYGQSIRLLEHSAWTSLTEPALIVLRNMTYLSQKFGKVLGTRMMFPLKVLEESDIPADINIPAKIRELEQRGLIESTEEDGATHLLFQRDKVQRILKTLQWLLCFRMLLDKSGS